jgi:hypothetical protein
MIEQPGDEQTGRVVEVRSRRAAEEASMDIRRIADKAKELVAKRGGTDSLKEDAAELKGIATGQGSLSDKAKAAVDAVKDPGAEESSPESPRPPEAAPGAGPDHASSAAQRERKRRRRARRDRGRNLGEEG